MMKSINDLIWNEEEDVVTYNSATLVTDICEWDDPGLITVVSPSVKLLCKC